MAQPGRPSDYNPGVYVGPAQPPRACFLSLYFVCVCYYFISSALQASPMGPLETLV